MQILVILAIIVGILAILGTLFLIFIISGGLSEILRRRKIVKRAEKFLKEHDAKMRSLGPFGA